MKIGDPKDSSIQLIKQYQLAEGMGKAADKRQPGGISMPEEKVDISSKSKEMQQIKNAIANLPDMREEKVQELKTQIEKGTYKIDSGKIAEKMVGESLIDTFA